MGWTPYGANAMNRTPKHKAVAQHIDQGRRTRLKMSQCRVHFEFGAMSEPRAPHLEYTPTHTPRRLPSMMI